jgi:general stress protein 26
MVATHAEQMRRLEELIGGIDVAMMTTVTPDGSLRSRPLASLRRRFDGTLWFFTRAPSGKTRELREDQHVNLSYADPRAGRFVSVSGAAAIVRDLAMMEELWRPELTAWFPDGPADPELALLRVSVREAEYWDTSTGGGGALVRLAGVVGSIVAGGESGAGGGGRVGPGENEKVRVS